MQSGWHPGTQLSGAVLRNLQEPPSLLQGSEKPTTQLLQQLSPQPMPSTLKTLLKGLCCCCCPGVPAELNQHADLLYTMTDASADMQVGCAVDMYLEYYVG